MTAAIGGSIAAVTGDDPPGRRIEKSGTGVTTTFFLNDTASPDGFAGASGSDALAEYDGSTSRDFGTVYVLRQLLNRLVQNTSRVP